MNNSLQLQYRKALQAARSGDVQAQLYLAIANLQGLGVSPAPACGAVWCRRAAEQGNARAQILLGYLYRTGTGVPQDMSTAQMWFARARHNETVNSEVQEALKRSA